MTNRILAAAVVALLWPLGADAAPATSLPSDRSVLAEINRVRANPQEYAEELRSYRQWFDGNVVRPPDDLIGVRTQEGVAAVDEAIAFLAHQSPEPPLDHGELLALAARDHAEEQWRTGQIGHRSPDGRMPGDRVKARGGDIYVGETIAYGPRDAATVVRQFVVDDGVPRRGHRALLFSAAFRFAGADCAPHPVYGSVCVVDYSGTSDGSPVLPGVQH